MGKCFTNDYRNTSQHDIENITSIEAQASTNTALQHDDGPDLITSTGTPRSLSKTAQHNRQCIASLVIQVVKHKAIPNEHDTDSTDGTGNPQTISKSTQHNNNKISKNGSSTGIGKANDIHLRFVEAIAHNNNEQHRI